ncbi:MAG: 6-carboxytetrahydropterin synthase QueD [Gemmatimonadota bacterium]|jgi:6-pyruvoyltetrahydropterin/6-carboxytetrahydropterin synthase|nr:6-carboxytetrahydropterin synthase QueD [Gemmatimonadota bacterium]
MTDFTYTISAQAHYDAAHFLNNYEGKCSRLHGHRYVVEAALQATELDDSGIAFDFIDLKKALRGIADELDHENLNELPQFRGVETSAENQAKYFFEEMSRRLPTQMAAGLLYARIWESPTQWAQYGPADAPLPAPQSPSG